MFDQQVPHLTSWILDGDGWIELGQDDFSRSQVRSLAPTQSDLARSLLSR